MGYALMVYSRSPCLQWLRSYSKERLELENPFLPLQLGTNEYTKIPDFGK